VLGIKCLSALCPCRQDEANSGIAVGASAIALGAIAVGLTTLVNASTSSARETARRADRAALHPRRTARRTAHDRCKRKLSHVGCALAGPVTRPDRPAAPSTASRPTAEAVVADSGALSLTAYANKFKAETGARRLAAPVALEAPAPAAEQ
jgi:hypothetical protein